MAFVCGGCRRTSAHASTGSTPVTFRASAGVPAGSACSTNVHGVWVTFPPSSVPPFHRLGWRRSPGYGTRRVPDPPWPGSGCPLRGRVRVSRSALSSPGCPSHAPADPGERRRYGGRPSFPSGYVFAGRIRLPPDHGEGRAHPRPSAQVNVKSGALAFINPGGPMRGSGSCEPAGVNAR